MIQGSDPGRLFISITHERCACGCTYCYVRRGKETLLDESEIQTLPERLAAHPDFVSGPRGTLLTFGFECDLFRTRELADGFLSALEKTAPLGNPIQISTKQLVREEWAARIAEVRALDHQVVVFVSCSTIEQAEHYESGTAPPGVRFASFQSLKRHRIPNCLLIKPFLPGVTDREVPSFVAAVRKNKPDVLCAGTLYLNEPLMSRLRIADAQVTRGLKHPLMTGSKWMVEPMPEFLKALEDAFPTIPIFRNSVCVVAYLQRVSCATRIWKRLPELCIGCQDCESISWDHSQLTVSGPTGPPRPLAR